MTGLGHEAVPVRAARAHSQSTQNPVGPGVVMRVLLSVVLAMLAGCGSSSGPKAPWIPVGTDATATIVSIVVERQDPQVVYALSAVGTLHRSQDAGSSWSAHALQVQLTSLVLDPAKPGRLYGLGKGLVYRSDDAGATWTLATSGLPGDVLSLAVTSGGTVYAVSLSVAQSTLWISRSTDSAASWSTVRSMTESDFSDLLVSPPTGADALYLARVLLATPSSGSAAIVERSVDGNSWTATTVTVNQAGAFLAAALFCIDPSDPLTTYLILSDRPTASQSQIGTSDSVFVSRDGASTWQASAGLRGDPRAAACGPGAAAYAAFNDTVVNNPTPGKGEYLTRSTDGGLSWTDVTLPVPGGRIASLAVDPRDANTVYVGVEGAGMFKTTTGGI